MTGLADAQPILDVFSERVRLVRDLSQQRAGEAHPVAPETARDSEMFARPGAESVEGGQRDAHQPGTPGCVRVQNGVVRLHCHRALLEPFAVGAQQVGRRNSVGVDDHHGIRAAFGQRARECEGERVPFPAELRLLAHDDGGPELSCARSRLVGAVVRHHRDAKELPRVV